MTPKDKAIELVEKFKDYSYVDWYGGQDEMNQLESAQECAEIAVGEMIAENESVLEMLKIHGDDRTILPVKFRIIWLKQVKKELTKL